jgi:hypothetical protein
VLAADENPLLEAQNQTDLAFETAGLSSSKSK